MASRRARRPSRARRGAVLSPAPPRDGLTDLTTALRFSRSAEDVMSVLVLEAERAFGAASAVAYLVCGATLELSAAMGRAEDAHEWLRSAPLSAQMPVARASREGQPGWYESRAALVEAFPGWSARVPHFERFGALAALPLRAGGVVLGAVGFAFDTERRFSSDERVALEQVAAAGAAALERARLLEAERAAIAAPAEESAPADEAAPAPGASSGPEGASGERSPG